MAYQGAEDLFNDSWRDPGDDCERTVFYILFAVGIAAGLAMFGHGLYGLFAESRQSLRLWSLFEATLGVLLGGGGIAVFVRESKHWDLRHLTADRVIAGGFLFGFALMLLGLQIGAHSGRAGSHVQLHSSEDMEGAVLAAGWLIGAGALDLTFCLVVGLAFAYAPNLQIRHRLARTRIERRYALDDKLNQIDEHPCPREDGFTPVVTLRLRDGRMRTLVCSESAYEMAKTGWTGTAVVRGKKLEAFH
jgi:hypothetical protein